ncbi:MAG: hypothetical protein WC908_00875 [Candidatus Paceibacterota bacterium]
MKKFFYLPLVLVVGMTLAFSQDVSKRETEIANIIARSVGINAERGVTNPDSIFPNQLLAFKLDAEDIFEHEVLPGETETSIVGQFLDERDRDYAFRPTLPSVNRTKANVPKEAQPPVVTKTNSEKKVSPAWIFFCIGFGLSTLIFLFVWLRSRKFRKEDKGACNKRIQALINHYLERISSLDNRLAIRDAQIEKLKNQLPIIAPEKVTDEWLENNNPIGEAITEDNLIEKLTDHPAMGERGVMPDLVIKTIATTKPRAVKMALSYDRFAITGLDKTTVLVGFNWNNDTQEWVELGWIASFCQNAFVSAPGKVKKIGKFTSLELAGENHPVVYTDEKVKDQMYPELAAKLVVKYHNANIADLEKAGASVTTPESPK